MTKQKHQQKSQNKKEQTTQQDAPVVVEVQATPETTVVEAALVEDTIVEAKVADTKAEKRRLTWEEANALVPSSFTSEDLKVKLRSIVGAARENLQIRGYNDGVKRSFSEVFNISWGVAEKALAGNRAERGRVVTFSLGPSYNHFILVIPKAGVKVAGIDRDGKDVIITQENAMDYIQAGTNHGRTYKKARHLAQQLNLAYSGIEPGKYTFSNEDNINMEPTPDGKGFVVLTRTGGRKPLRMEPSELLHNLMSGGEIYKQYIL